MSKTKIVLAGLLLCTAMLMTAAAQKTQTIPVTAVIEGGGIFTDPSYQIQSDISSSGSKVYNNSKSLQSLLISPGGDWHLITDYAPSKNPRKLGFDFNHPVSGSSIPTIPGLTGGKGVFSGLVWTLCDDGDPNTPNLLTIPTNPPSIINCGLYLGFKDSNGINYRIWMDNAGGDMPPTDGANITCNLFNNSGVCYDWTIVPSGSGVGRLMTTGVVSVQRPWTVLGYYNFNFFMHVTNP